MTKRVLMLMTVCVLVGLSYFAYLRYRAAKSLNTGQVFSLDSEEASGSRTGLLREAAKQRNTPDAPQKARMHAPFPNFPDTDRPDTDRPDPASNLSESGQPEVPEPAPPSAASSIAGSGKYQIYRQGDLTWRVNTQDGTSCILFATMQQWSKPIVYRHGCAHGQSIRTADVNTAATRHGTTP